MSDEDYEQGFLEGYDQGLSTDKEKSFLILAARVDELKTEITRLRVELAAVTEERDRMQKALKPFAGMLRSYHACLRDDRFSYVNPRVGDLRRARAALEGVTDKKEAGNE